jgi:DNA polymerase-3 subunit chi
MAGDPLAPETPVIVTDSEDAELPHYDMMVNLTQRTPAQFAQFARVFEIISTDEQDAAAGRQRYVAYKKQSYPLTHFVAGQT